MNALLFDLDDTLLDYSGGTDQSWQEACATCAAAQAGVDVDLLVRTVAETRQWFWRDPVRQREERLDMVRAWQRIAGHALTRLGVEHDGLDLAIGRDFASRRRAAMQLFPESLEILERLRRQGTPLGLVTNGDAVLQRDKVERFELRRYFEVVVIEGEFGVGKPDEKVYRHALAHLGVDPADAAMVGDHLEWDVAGAQRLGLQGIWIDRSGAGLADSPVRPHRIIRSLRELFV